MSQPYRVLIVDDEWVSAKVLDKMLAMRGCLTRVVNDSTQALDQLRQFKPDAVTVDSDMPGLSGSDVARKIRSEPGYESVLIVSISAFDDQEHAARAKAAGIDYLLPKPVDIEALCRILKIPDAFELTSQARPEIEREIASISAKLSAPSISATEWQSLHARRHALEQKLTSGDSPA